MNTKEPSCVFTKRFISARSLTTKPVTVPSHREGGQCDCGQRRQ